LLSGGYRPLTGRREAAEKFAHSARPGASFKPSQRRSTSGNEPI
jgi:hypothetical protein